MFSGQLVIGQAGLTQGELLPETKAGRSEEANPNVADRWQRSRCTRPSIGSCARLHPRSPYEKLGGYVHLPRLIDKAKLHRKGLLDGYNYKTVGFDKHLLSFLKIDGDAFEDAVHRLDKDDAILNWVEENAAKHSAGRNRALEPGDDLAPSRHRREKSALQLIS